MPSSYRSAPMSYDVVVDKIERPDAELGATVLCSMPSTLIDQSGTDELRIAARLSASRATQRPWRLMVGVGLNWKPLKSGTRKALQGYAALPQPCYCGGFWPPQVTSIMRDPSVFLLQA